MVSKLLSGYQPKIQLTLIWLALMILTLFSAILAEQSVPGVLTVVIICLSFAIKGSLVTERLMGLYQAANNVRWLMLSYYLVLPLLIGLAIIFPDWVQRLTTL